MEKFQEVAESQQKKEENKDATAAAGFLEKLSVEDKKTEEKASEEVPAKEEKDEEKDAKSEAVKVDAGKKDDEPSAST